MLCNVQNYIEQRGTVTVFDLTLHFHSDSQTLLPMLDRLTRKGRICKLPSPEKCTGCTCCPHSHLEIYQWVDKQAIADCRML